MTTILLATLRSVEIVKIAFYLSVSTLVINCCINYVLIYGKFGAPRLGVTGAAVGTLVARIVEVRGGAVVCSEKRTEPEDADQRIISGRTDFFEEIILRQPFRC
mgnify:CR=1 FL=1